MKTREELEAAGFESLTFEYFLPEERWMFVRACAQLHKGKREYEVLERDLNVREIFVRKTTQLT